MQATLLTGTGVYTGIHLMGLTAARPPFLDTRELIRQQAMQLTLFHT